MAHAQKPDFFFRRNGRVHLNRQGRQFSRLLAADMCASAVVMLDTTRSEIVWEYRLPTPFACFPFNSPPVRHRVPSHFDWSLHNAALKETVLPTNHPGSALGEETEVLWHKNRKWDIEGIPVDQSIFLNLIRGGHQISKYFSNNSESNYTV